MNPHIQTPNRNDSPPPLHLLLPLDPAKVRKDTVRLRILVTALFVALLLDCYVGHHQHVKDIGLWARGCHDGWKVCRAWAGMRNDIDASDDWGTPCGEGYQACEARYYTSEEKQ